MPTYKLAQSDDFSQRDLFRYLKNVTLPEYVKQAEADDFSTLRDLPKQAFADQNGRNFVVNRPDRIYVSNAYFQNKKAELEKIYGTKYVFSVWENIKNAAQLFDIETDLKDYNNSLGIKQAEDYSEQYVFSTTLHGNEYNLFPVKTASDLTHYAEQFTNEINKIPFEWRRKIAQNFVKIANDLGVDEIPTLICKYAGMYYPDLNNINKEILRRGNKLKKAEHKEAVSKIVFDTENINSNEEIFKVAEVMYYMEKMEGLYDNVKIALTLGDPVDMFFPVGIEKIAEDLNVIEMGGKKFSASDLSKVSSDIYEQSFGFACEPSNTTYLREVLPTMPRSDVQVFQKLSGLKPVA